MLELIDKIYAVAPAIVLVFARLSGMIATLPILSYPNVPMRVRMQLAIILSFIILPTIETSAISQMTGSMLGIAVMQELLVGLITGFGARVIFESFNMGGAFIGRQMGLAIANVMDPTSRNQIPIVSQLWTLVAMTIFFATNSHHLLVETLYRNFALLPLGTAEFTPAVGNIIVGAGAKVFEIAIHFAAPAMVFMLLIDIAIAFVARIMPQMNVFMVMLPLKLGIGFIVLVISLDIFQSLFDLLYTEIQSTINVTILNLKGA